MSFLFLIFAKNYIKLIIKNYEKTLLTLAIAFSSLMASAQFMVVADVDLEDFDTDSISERVDFGVGYMINDTWTVGAVMPAGDDEDFRVLLVITGMSQFILQLTLLLKTFLTIYVLELATALLLTEAYSLSQTLRLT